MSELAQDMRFAVRVLRGSWGVTLVAVGSLAVAIAGNTAVFGLISSLLFQPLTATNPEELVVMQERRVEQPSQLATLATSLANHADLAERSRTTRAWTAVRPTILGMRDGDRSEPVTAGQVQANFFDVLGVAMARGRGFLPEEGVPGGRRVAIVTPEFWERARGGEGDPLEAVLTLAGEPTEIVGILPEGFNFTFVVADVFVPLTESAAGSPRDRRDVMSIARMGPGIETDQLRAEVLELGGALAAEYPETQRDWTIDVFNARRDIPDARTKIFYGLLQGSVFFVLLIACANIANLLLARAQGRSREIALRTVLGANRGRIVRQLLTESAILTVGGAVVGLGLGWLGIRALAAHFADLLPANWTPVMDGPVVLFTAGLSVLAGVIFGVAPIGQTLRVSQAQVLKEGGGKASAGRSRKLVSRALVVAEIALSLIALGGGAMLVRSFVELRNADPGFDDGAIVTARLRVPDSRYPGDEERLALYDRVLERTAAMQGTTAAALVNALPRNFQIPTDTFRLSGAPRDEAVALPRAFVLKTSPAYLDVFGIPVLQGRYFEPGDRLGAAPVAVVNRSFAERWSPDQSPVGRFVDFDGASRQIVGVVEDVQQLLFRTPGQVESEAIYVPAAQSPSGAYTIVASAVADPAALKEPLRAEIERLDPDLTLSAVLTMEEVEEQFFAGVDVFNTILGGFGLIGILLASLGTYGVLAYQVSQRRHEIGIRMAIGARGREVVTMVTKQGLAMAVLGLVLGGMVLIPLTRLLESLLEGFATVHGSTSLAVAALLFAVTLAASLVPAFRASGLDPVRALRDE